MRRTALLMRILSGVMLEWIIRADVCRKARPLHIWRIPFWIYGMVLLSALVTHYKGDGTYFDFIQVDEWRVMWRRRDG